MPQVTGLPLQALIFPLCACVYSENIMYMHILYGFMCTLKTKDQSLPNFFPRLLLHLFICLGGGACMPPCKWRSEDDL